MKTTTEPMIDISRTGKELTPLRWLFLAPEHSPVELSNFRPRSKMIYRFTLSESYLCYTHFMSKQNIKEVVTIDRFNSLLEILLKKIQADGEFRPDTILALSTGGFPVAAAIAKRLGVRSRNVVGIPVYKDETGDYHLDDQLVSLGDCSNRQVLVVDEASKRGLLTLKAVTAVEDRGGMAKSGVLIAWKEGIQPDYVAETCVDDPPGFYWEYY